MSTSPEPSPSYLHGVDLSHHNRTINWDVFKPDFLVLKATESAGNTDPTFHERATKALNRGIPTGAYSFLHPKVSGAAQAARFLNVIADHKLTLPCVVDVEIDQGQSPQAISSCVADWITTVEATGREVAIYTSPSFWTEKVKSDRFVSKKLWIANYGVKVPRLPKPWSVFWCWQWTQRGSIEGVVGPVDLNKMKTVTH